MQVVQLFFKVSNVKSIWVTTDCGNFCGITHREAPPRLVVIGTKAVESAVEEEENSLSVEPTVRVRRFSDRKAWSIIRYTSYNPSAALLSAMMSICFGATSSTERL